MPTHQDGGRDELSRGLLALRNTAGLSTTQAGALTGVSQSKISRVERGRNVPTTEFVDILCRAYRAPVAERRRLVAMARDVRAGSRRVVLRRHVAGFQEQIGRVYDQSALVRSFALIGVPGLLQTEAYARALFASGDDLTSEAAAAGVRTRLANQVILKDRDNPRRFVWLLAEGALGWSLGPPEMMAEQVEHLAEATRLPNGTLGLIPWGTPTEELPLHGFELYDERHVIAGTYTATAMLNDQRDVAAYVALFERLRTLAVYDDEARALLVEVARRYRQQ